LDYSAGSAGPVTFNLSGRNGATTGIDGSWSGITTVTGSGNSDTISGTNKTYTLSGANAGSSGAVSWSSFENLTDSGAGTFRFADGSNLAGTITAAGGTLDYSGMTGPVAVNLTGKTGSGIGGVWSGITTVTGSGGSDTISGTDKTYTLSGANAGSSGGVSWTSFEKIADAGTGSIATSGGQTYTLSGVNSGSVTTLLPGGYSGIGNLTDTGAGSFRFTEGSSLTGTITAPGGTLDYSGMTGPVAVNLTGKTGSGIGGVWSGITTVTGSGSSDTISGTDKTYTLSGANAGSSGGVSWTSFEKIADAGTGSIATSGGQTYTLSGVNSGSVTTLLPGGYSGIGNLTDSGAGTFRFGSGGSLSGSITAVGGTLDYSAGSAGPVTVDLTAKTGSGIGATWSGITTVIGSGSSDTISGTDKTYTLTGANAGTSDVVSWVSFEKISDSGLGTVTSTGGQTFTLTGTNAGNVTGLLAEGYTGIGNLADTGAATFRFAAGGSVAGGITANGGTLDYSAGIVGPVVVNLASKTGTGVGTTWSGITSITGSGASDTMAGAGTVYNLTGIDAGTSGTVSWTSFENLHDMTAGTFNMGSDGTITGNLDGGSNAALDYGSYATPVTVNLTTQTGSGIGGTWSGITTVTGSAHSSDTITGSNQTFNLTGVNAGTNSMVSWTSFENIIGTAGSNAYVGSGGSLTGVISDAGVAATVQGVINTGGAQTYGGAVTLGGAATMMSTGSGDITFARTVDSGATAYDLTISTAGTTTFSGVVGTIPLNSLTITGGGTTRLNGGSVTTSGAAGQVYNGAVVLGADTVINSGSGPITLAGTLDGIHSLVLAAATGDITLSGAAGGTAPLGAVTITSAHDVTLSDMKAAGLTQSAGSGATALNGAVDATSGNDIRITTDGSITDSGALSTSGNGRVVLVAGGDVVINNTVTSSGPITLSAGNAITEWSAGALITAGLLTTQSGSGQTLIGNGLNAVSSFNASNSSSGDITLTNSASPLAITAINQTGGALILTNTGGITGSGPIVVTGATTLNAGDQPITLANADNDFGGPVSVTAAATSITDSNNLVAALTTTGPTILIAGADMTVSGTSTDTVSATAAGQATLSNPTASILQVTASTIAGTMNNATPLDLTTTAAQTPVTVNLTGSIPFLTFAGDVKNNIRSLGLYNGVVVMGTEMDHFNSLLDLRTAATALIGNSTRYLFTVIPANSDDFFTMASQSLIDSDRAFIAPETDPRLIDY
ncbi:MAG: hypothetical protein PHI31_10235, partial [Desulfuromonadaceae bacterium]|nr:hypothetical protein [Desulfuromonadaceae bacterium]